MSAEGQVNSINRKKSVSSTAEKRVPGPPSRAVFIFFPVKRKDAREDFGFENDHVLNFASWVDF